MSSVYKSRFFITKNEKVQIPDVALEVKKAALSQQTDEQPVEEQPEKTQNQAGNNVGDETENNHAEDTIKADDSCSAQAEDAPETAGHSDDDKKEEPPAPPIPPVTKELIGQYYSTELCELAASIAQQAYYDALNKKKAELRDCITGVQTLMDELVCTHQQFIEEYTNELKYMAVDIAEKMILEKIGEDDLILQRLVMRTVSTVKNADWINVEISERLVDLMDLINKELEKPEYNGRAHVFPVAGTDGYCRIVTNEGAIVSSIEVQADNLRRAFKELDQQDATRRTKS